MSRFDKLFEQSKKKSLTKYCVEVVARDLQRCIRAEYGAKMGREYAVVDGKIESIYSPFGQCVCITCGVVLPWAGSKMLGEQGMDAGHFMGRTPSIVLDERGLHPQCIYCNRQKSGAASEYMTYMLHKGGQKLVDDLRIQKVRGRALERIQLVERRIEILDRLKAAEELLRRGPPEMATAELVSYQPRQLTFDFDYSEAGFAPATGEVLDGHAAKFESINQKSRRGNAKWYVEAAEVASAAKKLFAKKPDSTWAEYCKQKLGQKAAQVNKLSDSWKVLKDVDVKILEGMPVSAYYALSQAPARLRNKALKAAEGHYLTQREVMAIVQPQDATKEIAATSLPQDHDELREAVEKRLRPLINKVSDTDLYEDLPVVLSEIAQELQGVEDE